MNLEQVADLSFFLKSTGIVWSRNKLVPRDGYFTMESAVSYCYICVKFHEVSCPIPKA